MPTASVSPYNPLQQQGVRAIQPPDLIIAQTAPTSGTYTPNVGTLWVRLNTAIYALIGKPLNVANWVMLAGASGSLVTLTGNSGGAISPTAGNINILGTGGLSFSGSGSTLTLSGTVNTFTWNIPATSQALVDDNGYGVQAGAQSFSLPATAVVGAKFGLLLNGGTSWTITQGAGQSIQVGPVISTVGAGGSVASTADGDSIWLICTTANTGFAAYMYTGTLNIV